MSPITPRAPLNEWEGKASLVHAKSTSDAPPLNSEAHNPVEDEGDTDSDWDSDNDSFATATEDSEEEEEEEEELTEDQREAEREARAVERQRVLEAAGFIITKTEGRNPPPRPLRRKNTRKRRPAPAVPEGGRHSRHVSKDLPPPPEADNTESSFRLDDAYERYEAYKQSNTNTNRLSMASIDTTSSMPSPSPSSTNIHSPSTDHDNRGYSHILHFFGRKTPANDGEARVMPVISAPILQDKNPSNDSLGGGNSDFGSVGVYAFTLYHLR